MNKEELKNKTLKFLSNIQTKNKQDTIDKFQLAYRTMKFFQYEDDPDFEKFFNDFCIKKAKEEKEKGELENER